MNEIKILRGAEQEFDRLNKQAFEYFTGKANDDVYEQEPLDLKVTKSDLEIYMKAYPPLQEMQRKLHIQRAKVHMLEDYIKSVINARGFQIRDAIEFLKFKNGLK